ncbi:hypothetical protein CCACVL1_15613 [Corchorus capsularis]|uniref:F-box domain-containing protein n=1 Tax=Corchorus capsularis TaxID=210143 RepID=A0A1R3I1P8_COCAP|nr:hypothetical protein CCACVL1_15613 [Corchorus capsularis]
MAEESCNSNSPQTDNPRQRRRNLECFNEEDRLSSLPHSLIHHILSLMPIEDAVKTTFLSKKWAGLWTSVPNLIFTYQGQNFPHFFQFIDKTLSLYSSEKVQKFTLSFHYPNATTEENSNLKLDASIDSWLQFATTHKVEELHLDLEPSNVEPDEDAAPFLYQDGHSGFIMPRSIYEFPSLTKLFTRFCDFEDPEGQVSWGKLKVLTFCESEFLPDVLQKILSGCPLLETLELINCRYLDRIDTSSSTVFKRLVINEVQGLPAAEVTVPSVTSLEISGNLSFTTFQILNVPSLNEATVDFQLDSYDLEDMNPHVTFQEVVKQLLYKLKHVKHLTLGPWCIQVLSLLEIKGPPYFFTYQNCKQLTLVTSFNKRDLHGVANLLNRLPNLEKLVILLRRVENKNWFSKDDVYCLDYTQEGNFWAGKESCYECLLRRLKIVEIVGLNYYNQLSDFCGFILRTANMLEKLVIVPAKNPGLRLRTSNLYGMAHLQRVRRFSPHAFS